MFNRTLAAFALAAPLFVLGCNATTAAIPVTEVPARMLRACAAMSSSPSVSCR